MDKILTAEKETEMDKGIFQILKDDDIVNLANGKYDVIKIVMEEVANRGLGIHGEWIGFEAAKKLWDYKYERNKS